MSMKHKNLPPKVYAERFDAPPRMVCEAIAFVRSPYQERYGTPYQASGPASANRPGEVEARIEFVEGRSYEQALRDLEGFDYVWVLAWMHLNRGWSPLVQPPRGPRVKRGLLSTRSPHRPNPIALSAVGLERIEGRVLHVRGIDLLDGTPVLDVKPYVPYADAFPDARAGWTEEIGDQP